MVEAIRRGICSSIHNAFGSDYSIYTEKVEQGFRRPGFFVESSGGSLELFRGKRYYMKNPFIITYYPPYKDRKGEMVRVGEQLALALNSISLEGDQIRGSTPITEHEVDCLKCRVSYDFFVIIDSPAQAAELMEEYSLYFKE